MKKALLPLIFAAALLLTACGGGGNVDKVGIPDWKPSEIYTDAEIEAAFKTVKSYFSKEFDGCTLTKLYYPGDKFQERTAQYDADKAIIICSSFDVDSSGGDGSLNPNSTYEDSMWILVSNNGGEWEHFDHGY